MKEHCLHNPVYSLLLVLVSFTFCNGQSKLIKTQGASIYSNIRCGLQDKAGNLWFGTSGEGAYRYDGKSFTQLTTKDGLPHNVVLSVVEDRSGRIWIGTETGICRYDGKTITDIPIMITEIGNFNTKDPINTLPAIKPAVWSMFQDNTGIMWFGTSEGMYCHDGKAFTRFLDNASIINNGGLQLKMVDCIMQDKKGSMWFASGMLPGDEGVCCYDGRSLTSFKPHGNGWIRTILEDKNGMLCIATRHAGVSLYDGKTCTNFTEQAGIRNGSVTTIFKDSAGNLWIGTELGTAGLGEGGLWRYDGKTFTRFTTQDGMVHNAVWCIMEDKAGNIWVGTRNNGLCRYDGKTFTVFSE